MRVSDFDFHLPESAIADRPLPARDASRLLELTPNGNCHDRQISDLTQLVQPGDLWILNDTKVIPARLIGSKPHGGKVEILLLEPLARTEHRSQTWLAWGRANKPLKPGTTITFAEHFSANIISRNGKQIEIELNADDVAAAIEQHGHMPLPPYINRPDSDEDKARYQTVYARHSGAVAAPTAGLHLTKPLMQQMQNAGATFAHVTLHVGPGTFQPVQVEQLDEHVMHEEAYIVPPETADLVNQAKREGRRIVAIGTTSLRTLEAATVNGELTAGPGRTDIFIKPGYQFRMVDALLTNFHLPKSTLIMLVSALAGREHVLNAYEHAKAAGYRFYSYGDAMFVSTSLR